MESKVKKPKIKKETKGVGQLKKVILLVGLLVIFLILAVWGIFLNQEPSPEKYEVKNYVLDDNSSETEDNSGLILGDEDGPFGISLKWWIIFAIIWAIFLGPMSRRSRW